MTFYLTKTFSSSILNVQTHLENGWASLSSVSFPNPSPLKKRSLMRVKLLSHPLGKPLVFLKVTIYILSFFKTLTDTASHSLLLILLHHCSLHHPLY